MTIPAAGRAPEQADVILVLAGLPEPGSLLSALRRQTPGRGPRAVTGARGTLASRMSALPPDPSLAALGEDCFKQ